MRVALVHDDLVQWGGAERMLFGLCEAYPEAPVFTTLYDDKNPLIQKKFKNKRIVTSFLQKIPEWRMFYKAFLPLYPLAFEQFDFSDFDLVISHTSRFAKAVITKPGTIHICWCMTPPRFLWNFSSEKPSFLLSLYLSYLRVLDIVLSRRVDFWLANSQNSAKRIKRIYRKEARVLYPFVDLERFRNIYTYDGGYYLVVSRLNSYKKIGVAIEAAKLKGFRLKVVGSGPELRRLVKQADGRIEFLSGISDEKLSWVLAGCRALIIVAEEDFGLTALEANAAGKPVVAYKAGGALETVTPFETGYFFEVQTPKSLIAALEELEQKGYNKNQCIKQAAVFGKKRFLEQLRKLIVGIKAEV